MATSLTRSDSLGRFKTYPGKRCALGNSRNIPLEVTFAHLTCIGQTTRWFVRVNVRLVQYDRSRGVGVVGGASRQVFPERRRVFRALTCLSLGLASLVTLGGCGNSGEETTVLDSTPVAGAMGASPPGLTDQVPDPAVPNPPGVGGQTPNAGAPPSMGQGGAQGGAGAGGAPGATGGATGTQTELPPAAGGSGSNTGGFGAAGSATDTGSGDEPDTTSEAETPSGTSTDDELTTEPAGPPGPEPSSGCGQSPGSTGNANQPLSISHSNGQNQYYIKLPAGYDQDHPYPVVMMFNPTNNPIDWAEQNAGFEQTGAAQEAIRVYPHMMTLNSGWGAGDVPFFEPLYNSLLENFCIDKTRVFAAGESSGGDFVSILGCEHADKLRAVGPCATKNVPQYPLNVEQRNCTGQVAAVVIHSPQDNVVGAANGEPTRDFYGTLNSCGMMTTPVDGYTDPQSNCVRYEGCDEGYPVFWCPHLDPEYNNTYHGWPRFAAKMLWEVFSTL